MKKIALLVGFVIPMVIAVSIGIISFFVEEYKGLMGYFWALILYGAVVMYILNKNGLKV